jgi:hypothetical protein
MKKQYFTLFVAATLATTTSCQSTPQQKFEAQLSGGKCEEAYYEMPENSSSVKFVRATQKNTGKILSYTATGAGYAAEVVANVTGGALIFIALCGPILLAAAHGGGGHIACLPADISGVKPVKLGQKTYDKTAKWRCPNLTPLTQSIEQVAACYVKKGDTDNLKKAEATLSSLEKSDSYFECLSEAEKSRITEKLFDIRKSLVL